MFQWKEPFFQIPASSFIGTFLNTPAILSNLYPHRVLSSVQDSDDIRLFCVKFSPGVSPLSLSLSINLLMVQPPQILLSSIHFLFMPASHTISFPCCQLQSIFPIKDHQILHYLRNSLKFIESTCTFPKHVLQTF